MVTLLSDFLLTMIPGLSTVVVGGFCTGELHLLSHRLSLASRCLELPVANRFSWINGN